VRRVRLRRIKDAQQHALAVVAFWDRSSRGVAPSRGAVEVKASERVERGERGYLSESGRLV
jgi:hypothetical protein